MQSIYDINFYLCKNQYLSLFIDTTDNYYKLELIWTCISVVRVVWNMEVGD